MEQSPEAFVVQVRLVAVSSAPCGGAPSSGALSVNSVNTAPDSGAPMSSCLWIFTVPQLLMFTGCGATKSLISAGNEADERLFRNTLPSASQVPAGKTLAAVRLTAASPKVPAGRLTLAMGSVTATELTAPSAKPAALRFTRLPQQGSELLEKH